MFLWRSKKKFDSFKLWRGTILLAPLIYSLFAQRVNTLTVTTLKVVHTVGLGSLALGPKPSPDGFPSAQHFEKFKSDTLRYTGKLKLSTAFTLIEMASATQLVLHEPQFPFLVIHGEVDSVVSIKGSLELFEKSKTIKEHKAMITYPNASHGLIEDVGPQLWMDILTWIDKMVNTQWRE